MNSGRDKQAPNSPLHRRNPGGGLSQSHFSREFARAFGETAHQYLLTRRLERAAALLRNTDRSVTEICFLVGLTSPGSFTTSFGRRFTMTPSDYRSLDKILQKEISSLMGKGFAGTVFLETDDCEAAYQELLAKGVEFTETPERRPYGIDCGFRDPSGNSLRLTQRLELP